MKVSDLVEVVAELKTQESDLYNIPHIKIELPYTDAVAMISNDRQLQTYIEAHGDIAVEYSEKLNRYTLPDFANERAEYVKAKAADCMRYGCE